MIVKNLTYLIRIQFGIVFLVGRLGFLPKQRNVMLKAQPISKNYKRKGNYPDRNLRVIKDNLSKKIYDKEVCSVSLKFRPHYPDSLRLLPESNIKTIKESLYTLESEKNAQRISRK